MRTTLVMLAALGLAACNNNSSVDNMAAADNAAMDNGVAADGTGATTDGVVPATLGGTPTTTDFVNRAAMSDMLEIESAKVALERTKNADIRKFANQMIADHTATTASVKAIVAKDNLSAPPMALDADHQKMLDEVRNAGADFDRVYLDQQTKAHSDALSLMKSYADSGDNADLKAFATATAPKIQGHLDMVKALDKGGADGTR